MKKPLNTRNISEKVFIDNQICLCLFRFFWYRFNSQYFWGGASFMYCSFTNGCEKKTNCYKKKRNKNKAPMKSRILEEKKYHYAVAQMRKSTSQNTYYYCMVSMWFSHFNSVHSLVVVSTRKPLLKYNFITSDTIIINVWHDTTHS